MLNSGIPMNLIPNNSGNCNDCKDIAVLSWTNLKSLRGIEIGYLHH